MCYLQLGISTEWPFYPVDLVPFGAALLIDHLTYTMNTSLKVINWMPLNYSFQWMQNYLSLLFLFDGSLEILGIENPSLVLDNNMVCSFTSFLILNFKSNGTIGKFFQGCPFLNHQQNWLWYMELPDLVQMIQFTWCHVMQRIFLAMLT